MTSPSTVAPTRQLLNRVPQVTLYFWVIKILCTTVGESAADFLNINLNFGLTGTSLVTGVLLVLALVAQFRAKGYRPARYWTAVALVSVFGTLVTDNLTDALGVPLEASTVVFAVLLAAVFLAWYRRERTLSIHSIVTARREAFYWLAILVTFALGTAAGDLMSEVLGLGYAPTGLIVAAAITLTALAWRIGLDAVLAFWIIYILTRPLGASIGDYLAQSHAEGGLGLGATAVSVIFTVGIVGLVGYLMVSKADVIRPSVPAAGAHAAPGRGALVQTVAVLAVVLAVGGSGYALRKATLDRPPAAESSAADTASPGGGAAPDAGPGTTPDVGSGTGPGAAPGAAPGGGGASSRPAAPRSPLGNLSEFRVITQDTLDLLNAGRQSEATTRITDLETAWDDAEARLKPRNKTAWTDIDGKIDTVLRELRSTSPRPATEKAALSTLLAALS